MGYDGFEGFGDRGIVEGGEYRIVFVDGWVGLEYVEGYMEEVELEGEFCVVGFGEYGVVGVEVEDVVIGELVNVEE